MSTPFRNSAAAPSTRTRGNDFVDDDFQPFKELKPKEFTHLTLTNPTINFSWRLLNLRSHSIQNHPGYRRVYDEDSSAEARPFHLSFSKLLYHIVRDADAYVILVDAAARYPDMPGSMGLTALIIYAFLPDPS